MIKRKSTTDPSKCYVHRIVEKDGRQRFVVGYPTKWTASTDKATSGGKPITIYDITEWDEVELVLPDKKQDNY